MRVFIKTFLIGLLLTMTVCGQVKKEEKPRPEVSDKPAGLTVKYIGNEGVLISSDDRQILIDGLHREYKPAYAFPPADLLNSLEQAKAPYDKIDLLLVSHIHLDHFHTESVGRHLQNNPRSRLITSEQAAGEIAASFAGYEKIRERITPVRYVWKKSEEFEQNGIRLKVLNLRHANEQHRSIQNLGHLIGIGGRKLLHIGDADMTAENFSAFGLQKENIDIAFIPYWYLISESGRTLVREQFAPRQIIAVHIPPAEAASIARQIREFYPDADAFTQILEEKSF